MILETLDWIIVIAFLALSLIIGLRYKNQAGKDMNSFFLGGRNMPWYLAGISMVATTFAADTPLAVTELVATKGISGNWLWWNMLAGGMLTTFFFAKYWRRAEILTEVEFIELRYSGKPAAFLRGFKAIYLGLFMNVLIIGWVNTAMISILEVFLNIPPDQAFWFTTGLMLIALVYSSLSGLMGVAITDTIQFFIAIIGCTILAVIVLNSEKINGIQGLKASLPEGSLDFLPKLNSSSNDISPLSKLGISIGAFLSFSLVQWWASWYPGAEPGGGGYIAQRMMSTKDEKHSLYATLFFQIAHYCLRPWPWIIVALCSMVLYPDLVDKKLGYVMAMKDFLPTGLRGLLFVAFIAAYMSTISTQLNWGASYLTNDFINRFILKNTTDKTKIITAKATTLLIMIVAAITTTFITSISSVWEFIIECGAGLGLVLILRWYWWRINAWSEITATITPFVVYGLNKLFLIPTLSQEAIDNRIPFFITVGITTLVWIITTFSTSPTKIETLEAFYNKIKPAGNWKIFKQNNEESLGTTTITWLVSIVFTYSFLFLTGKVIFQEWQDAGILFCITSLSLFSLIKLINKINLTD
jgi:SSS family solute:Na+ symporter